MDRNLDRNIFLKISNYSAHMHNFTISICYKSSFSGLQTIKVTFFILFFLFVPSFLSPLCLPFVSPLCVSPLCLPVVSPQGGDPNATSRGERFAPTRARWWKTKASSVFTGVVYEPIRVIPRTEGKTTRKDIRVVPRQEAKPPGKTSELSFLGHRWRNFRHFASKGRDALKPNFNKWPEGPVSWRQKRFPQVTC